MANLLTNPDFELGTGSRTTAGWLGGADTYGVYYQTVTGTLAFDTGVKHGGAQSVRLDPGVGIDWNTCGPSISSSDHSIVVTPNTEYELSAYLKSNGFTISGGGLQMYAVEYDNANNFQAEVIFPSSLAGTQDWTKLKKIWTTGANTTRLVIQYIRAHGHGGNLYVDDAYLGPPIVLPSARIIHFI